MDNLLLLFCCLAAGVGLRYSPAFPKGSHNILNAFVIWVSLPALALYYIPKIKISTELLFPLGVGWISFGLAFTLFATLGKIFGWSRKLIGCLVLMGGLGNTSFVGFPVIEALYGTSGLQTAIIVDQPGSFMVMATLGIIVAATYSKGSAGFSDIGKKILGFPPFLAFFVAIALNLFGNDFPEMFQSVFQKLGNTVTPVALVAVGLQLEFSGRSRHWGFLSLGLVFKMLVTPLFFFVLYKLILSDASEVTDVCIMEAAMAPMITASVLCATYNLKPKLASMMIGIGIPLSFLTLSVWYFVLQYF